MLSVTDASRRNAPVVPERKRYSRIPEVLPIPDLIELQRDSFHWFIEHGLRELLDEISPIQDFTGKVMELHFKALRVRRAQVLRARVPHPRPDLLQAALRGRRAAHQGDRRDPGAARLHGRLPDHDRAGHVHHQRRRARRGQPAGALAGRLLHRRRGPGHRPPALQRQGHPQPRRLAGVRDRRPQPAVRQGRPQAQARGHQAAARRRLRVQRRDGRPVLARGHRRGRPTSPRRSRRTAPTRARKRSSRSTRSCARATRPPATTPRSWSRASSSTSAATTSAASAATSSTRSSDPVADRMGIELPRDQRTISHEDIAAIVGHLIELNNGLGQADDIDHLGNRRIRANGELIQNAFRVGLLRMERVVKERMTIQEIDKATPNALINIRPVVAAMKEFFGGSQLSQFMDQTNPLAELTSKRRLSALGPGRPVARARRLRRARRAPQPLRPHLPHRDAGRPEHRPHRLAGHLRPDQRVRLHRDALPQGQAQRRPGTTRRSSARSPDADVATKAGEVVLKKGERFTKEAVAELKKQKASGLPHQAARDRRDRVPRRLRRGGALRRAGQRAPRRARATSSTSACRPATATSSPRRVPQQIDYMDVSPKQVVSVATALIPFLEHDDANRALMGSNMQRQAVPLLEPEAPIVGTGMEARAARDSGQVLVAQRGRHGPVGDRGADPRRARRGHPGRAGHVPPREVRALQPGHLHQPAPHRGRGHARRGRARCWPTAPPPTTASWPSAATSWSRS